MSGQSEDEDKQHDATAKKLEDARKKGEIARSADLNTAASYAGLALVAVSVGAASLSQLGDVGFRLLHHADSLSADLFHSGAVTQFGGLLLASAFAVAPFFAGPALLSLCSVVVQRSFVVAPSKIQPKLSRISPLSNAKNKFGRSGLFEFAKSAAKLVIFSLLLTIYLFRNLPDMLATMHLAPAMAMAQMMNMSVEFLLFVVVIAVIMGAGDFLWQRGEHLRKNRMSHQELKDEVKQSEGDPHVKQQRRQKGMAIAMNQMLADVPSADVIIVNPTHFAVALKWDRSTPGAPLCVAKGVDEIAARIRESAAEAGVPIHSDPPTARALHATVDIGQEISKEHYAPVAAAIRFSEAMRAKARAR
ncbi:flagellar type III secretion system protein FlhB [Actibacterium lipolyticum]|uniref:Flagellar biosynthetic protein FlhB n=1 Tax=Actibacterium lipolyticum TaxID=1524263 RepID=A0A238KX43_9RHOB|nr:flagellar type III secretion system protein FlhB [Actibacterium lipolyticum]SMX47404.1 Flagellar biosynthetic protein FlhB [Actibacterium lipolyticum]